MLMSILGGETGKTAPLVCGSAEQGNGDIKLC